MNPSASTCTLYERELRVPNPQVVLKKKTTLPRTARGQSVLWKRKRLDAVPWGHAWLIGMDWSAP